MDSINELFLIASVRGNIEDVKKLLGQGADINIKNNHERTALNLASNFGHFEMVKELLINGADPNIQDVNGWTALHTSCWDRSLEIMRELLINGADPNLRDDKGRTFLDHIKNPEKKREIEELMESIRGINIKG